MMDVTPDTIANEVLLIRNASRNSIVIVEGGSDVKLFKKFAINSRTEFVNAWGKENVLSSMEIIKRESIIGAIGIVDADFSRIAENGEDDYLNVLVTDFHDIEIMILQSASFSNFLNERASPDKLSVFLNAVSEIDVRVAVLKIAKWVGYLRYYSQDKRLNLVFEGLKFDTFIDRKNLSIDIQKMIECVLALTKNSSYNITELAHAIKAFDNDNSSDLRQICCGHDVTEILSIALRSCIGSNSSQACSIDNIESSLRLCYDSKCFSSTNLYRSAKEWERGNAPFIIFDTY